MKNIKSKKLSKKISTVCDFSMASQSGNTPDTTNTGTDPTNTTTITISTIALRPR